MHCATTALGISHEHLTQGSELIKSFYRFHVMYHIRRVLYLLNSPIPENKEFKKYDNYFNHEAYLNICSEYNVNKKSKWIIGNWPYTAEWAVFGNRQKKTKASTYR